MAFPHIHFDDQTQYGRKLRRLLNMMEEGDDLFVDVRDVMIQMRSGDGSDPAHYAEVTMRFGFGGYVIGNNPASPNVPTEAQNTKAREAFLELDSAYSKTSGNASVDNVRAARDQLFAKLRG